MNGDDEELARRYREYGPVIYSRCRRLWRDETAAVDATQKTFVSVLKHLHKAPPEAMRWIDRETAPAEAGQAGHPSSLQLDLMLSGALELDAHVAGCDRCRRDLDARRADGERFLTSVYPKTIAAVVRDQRAPFVLRWVWVVAPILVISAMLLMIFRVRGPGALLQGGPSLQIVARHDGKVFNVAPGRRLAAGDQLRFVVQPGGNEYLLIAGADGLGKVTIYYPFGGTASARLDGGGRLELPGSFVLDDAPGPERIVAVFSHAPVAADTVANGLAVPGATQVSVVIQK